MERGSEFGYAPNLKSDKGTRELFIKEGNAEILRLITRGKNEEENIYVNLPGRPIVSDNQVNRAGDVGGKEILMRRYIEEQANGKQIIREHYQIIPNQTHQIGAVGSHGGSNMYQDINGIDEEKRNSDEEKRIAKELEESLKQQNELLRQILLEKEKLEEKIEEQEAALETQSLPCAVAIATQTDCEATTQTDPINGMLEKRLSKSENDDSMSEDDYEYIKYTPPDTPEGVCWIKRKRQRIKRYKNADRKQMVTEKKSVKRKIRTPILEETEDTNVISKTTTAHKTTKQKNEPHQQGNSKINIKNTPKIKHESFLEANVPMKTKKKKLNSFSTNNEEKRQYPRIYKKNVRYYGDSEGSEKEVIIKKNYYSADSLDLDTGDLDEALINPGSSSTLPAQRTNKFGQRQIEFVADENFSTREPQGKPPKRKAPKPPFDTSPKPRSRFYTSESNLVRRMREEGIHDVPHGVSRYMDWYYNKNKDKDISDAKDNVESKSFQQNEGQKRHKNGKLKIRAAIRHNNGVFNVKRISPARLSRSEESLNNCILDATNRTTKRNAIENLIGKASESVSVTLPSHPLLQHSEHRYEHEYEKSKTKLPLSKVSHCINAESPPIHNHSDRTQNISSKPSKTKVSPIKENEVSNSKSQVPLEQLNVSNLEDDHDSGIAMNSLLNSLSRGNSRNPIADKKSVFTIAYNEVRVDQIPNRESCSPPLFKN
ncbi:cadherin-86C-like [Culicoides brevitarsis]|uniref:cadherin-86C-like n=1 Tax=Culicoides brevitarsis TaxID=469753 RepID=UPI00307CA386